VPGDAKGTRAFHGQLLMQSQDTASASASGQPRRSAPTTSKSATASVTVIGDLEPKRQRQDHREQPEGGYRETKAGSGNESVEDQDKGSGGAAAAAAAVQVVGDEDWADDIYFPPTSAPPSPSVATKRRFSFLERGDSDIATPSLPNTSSAPSTHPSTSSVSKRGRVSGAVALTSIGHSITGFTSVYRQGIELEQARHEARAARRGQGANSSSSSSSRAMDKAQTVECDLSSDELATLLEIFEEESTANAYLQIRTDELRKAWVRRKLAAAAARV
jgi:hypothetical protein